MAYIHGRICDTIILIYNFALLHTIYYIGPHFVTFLEKVSTKIQNEYKELGSPDMGICSPDMGIGSTDMGIYDPDMGIDNQDMGIDNPDMGIDNVGTWMGNLGIWISNMNTRKITISSKIINVNTRKFTILTILSDIETSIINIKDSKNKIKREISNDIALNTIERNRIYN